RVPKVPVRRGIGQIELSNLVDPHSRRNCSSSDVNPSHGVAITHNLSPYEFPGLSLGDKFDPKLLRIWVIRGPVDRLDPSGNDRDTFLTGLTYAQTRSRHRKIEHLQYRSTERARELGASGGEVLSGDTALFGRNCSEVAQHRPLADDAIRLGAVARCIDRW